MYHDVVSGTTPPVHEVPTLDTAIISLASTGSGVKVVTRSSTSVILHSLLSLSMLRYSPYPFDGGLGDLRPRSGTAFTAFPRHCSVVPLVLGTVRDRDFALTGEERVRYCCACLRYRWITSYCWAGFSTVGFSRLAVGWRV